MHYGFVYPGGDARDAAECAAAAEAAGWDGFFVWDSVWGVDPWVSLAAAAMRTERIRLGTMLTPPSRRRPWKLAAETATLDRLSNGRLILSVGLGAVDTGFADFGEVTDRRTRAELLDESLTIITALWRGQSISFEGQHFHLQPTKFMTPPPAQQQPIPIWMVGAWPRPKSMARAARYAGLLPNVYNEAGAISEVTPAAVRDMKAYALAHGAPPAYDVIVEGVTEPGDAAGLEKIRAMAAAGATWWLEALWALAEGSTLYTPAGQARILDRVQAGPPRID